MTDGIEATQRAQHAKHIAMNGADISGPIERHRAGKNSFVIDDFGEHLVPKNNEAIAVVTDGKERVHAWDVFRRLSGIEPEQANVLMKPPSCLRVVVLILGEVAAI